MPLVAAVQVTHGKTPTRLRNGCAWTTREQSELLRVCVIYYGFLQSFGVSKTAFGIHETELPNLV